jgi:hypothetical protein
VIRALRAFIAGLWAVARAPLVVAFVSLATLVAALPFAAVIGDELQTALAHQPPIDLAAEEIDAEWWLEYRRHATGLMATFTPAIIGFAAPIENLSALADGTRRPWALVLPVAIYAVLWSFLWGGILFRFKQGTRVGIGRALSAALSYLPHFIVISALAGVVVLALFLTVHRVLFGPLYGWIAAGAATEPIAFTGRVMLYLVFGSLLAAVSLVADYTRVALVTHASRSLREGVVTTTRFIRANLVSVVGLCALSAGAFAVALAAYGVADLRVGGWRAVLLGQAFVVGRLALRLAAAASQVELYRRSR